jgi:hypothetical protein
MNPIQPVDVTATAGTQAAIVIGGFDPVPAIGDVPRRCSTLTWLHSSRDATVLELALLRIASLETRLEFASRLLWQGHEREGQCLAGEEIADRQRLGGE